MYEASTAHKCRWRSFFRTFSMPPALRRKSAASASPQHARFTFLSEASKALAHLNLDLAKHMGAQALRVGPLLPCTLAVRNDACMRLTGGGQR